MKKNEKILMLTGVLFLLFAFESCYNDEVLPEPVNATELGELSFAADILPIFNKSCNSIGCHNPGGEKPDLSAANAYNSLLAGNFINTEVPENSELYQWVIGNRDQPMPLTTGTDAAISAKILIWIRQGAKNN